MLTGRRDQLLLTKSKVTPVWAVLLNSLQRTVRLRCTVRAVRLKRFLFTLLLPAGITSEASIRYKDEAELLEAADDVDKVYVEEVLPGKMKFNLQSIMEFSFIGEIATMFRTVFAVLGKDYSDSEQKSRV